MEETGQDDPRKVLIDETVGYLRAIADRLAVRYDLPPVVAG